MTNSCSPLEWILKKLWRYSFHASKIPWLFQFRVKFPDFSEFYKIPWLFQEPQNSLSFPGFQKFQFRWPPCVGFRVSSFYISRIIRRLTGNFNFEDVHDMASTCFPFLLIQQLMVNSNVWKLCIETSWNVQNCNNCFGTNNIIIAASLLQSYIFFFYY